MIAATAMQIGVGEPTWPVLAGIKWQRQFHAMLATPVGVRDVVVGHLGCIVAARRCSAARSSWRRWRVLGAILGLAGVLALPSPWCWSALAFAAPMFAFAARARRDTGFTIMFRLVLIPMFLFSGTFFPVEPAAGAGCSRSRASPRCGTASRWRRDATLGTASAWGRPGARRRTCCCWVVGRRAGSRCAGCAARMVV